MPNPHAIAATAESTVVEAIFLGITLFTFPIAVFSGITKVHYHLLIEYR